MKVILLFIFISFTIVHAQTYKTTTLVLPWKHQFQFAGYYIAKEKGYYKDAGLDVIIQEDDLKIDSAQGVASSKYEFAIRHSSLIVDKINRHPNLILLAAMQQSSPLVLISKKRDDIQSIADLKHKNIMLHPSEMQVASVNAMLFAGGLNKDDFNIVDMNFDIIDLIDGTIDVRTAYLSNEPFILKEKGVAYTVFNPKDYGYDFYSDILFTSTHMINHHPDLVKSFTLASLKGWRYAYENIDESIEIILNKYNTQNKTKKALLYEAQILKDSAFKNGNHFGEIDPDKLKKIINDYRFLGIINQDVKINANEFIYHGIIHQMKEHYKAQEKRLLLEEMYYEYRKNIILLFIVFLFGLSLALYFSLKTRISLLEKEKELERNYEIFDKYINSSKIDLNKNITAVSDAYCKLSGYTAKELIGKPFEMTKDPSIPNTVYEDMWLTVSSGHKWEGELSNIAKDGSIFCVKVIMTPIFDKKGNTIGYEDIKIEK